MKGPKAAFVGQERGYWIYLFNTMREAFTFVEENGLDVEPLHMKNNFVKVRVHANYIFSRGTSPDIRGEKVVPMQSGADKS